MAIDRTEWLSIEQNGYRYNIVAINRIESTEQNCYQLKGWAIDKTKGLH